MGSFVSPAPVDVANAVANMPFESVGSYMMLGITPGAILAGNNMVAGSSLRRADTYNYNGNGNYGQSGYAPAGTWRLHGVTGYYNGGAATPGIMMSVSIWMRIA